MTKMTKMTKMTNKEILSITSLSCLGACLLIGLYLSVSKPKSSNKWKQLCNLLVFMAVVLVGVSQLLKENKNGYKSRTTLDDAPTPTPLDDYCDYSDDIRCGGCSIIKTKIDNYNSYCKSFNDDLKECGKQNLCTVDGLNCVNNGILEYRQWINDLFVKSGNENNICMPLNYMETCDPDKNHCGSDSIPLENQGIKLKAKKIKVPYLGDPVDGCEGWWQNVNNYNGKSDLIEARVTKTPASSVNPKWTYTVSDPRCEMAATGQWPLILPYD